MTFTEQIEAALKKPENDGLIRLSNQIVAMPQDSFQKRREKTELIHSFLLRIRDLIARHKNASTECESIRSERDRLFLRIRDLEAKLEQEREQAEMFRYLCKLENFQQADELKGCDFCVQGVGGIVHWGETYEEAVRKAMNHDKGKNITTGNP